MLTEMDIYTIVLLVSLLAYVAIGNYAGRGVKGLDDYYVAGRRAPTILIVGTLVASVLSTNAFLGETGFVYAGQAGPYLLFPPTAAMGYVLGAVFFGRYLRRSEALTVADYFGRRFNSRRVQYAAGVTIVLALGGYLLAVTQGAAVLLVDLVGVSYQQGLLLAWVTYTLFTMYAGSRGVILTDTLMFLLFTCAAFFALLYLVDAQGGWVEVVTGLVQVESKPEMMSWHGIVGPGTEWDTPMDYLIWALIIDLSWGVVYAVSPWQSSRHLMAANEHVVLRSAVYACLALILVQIFLYAGAVTINLSKPDIEPYEQTMIWAARNIMPEFLGATLLAGIMAAALSSASTFLSLVGFSVNNDLLNDDSQDERRQLRFTRLSMLVVGFITLVMSMFFPPSIFWLIYFVGTVFASSWGPVAFMSVWSKKITADAAFWGLVVGFVGNVFPKFLDYMGWISLPSYLDPIVIGGALSLIAIHIVSSRGKVTRKEKAYRLRLHRTPNQERSPGRSRATFIALGIMIVYAVLTTAAYQRWYILPYQAATNQLADDGGLNWFTGEVMVNLLTVVWMVPVALLTIWLVRKSYGKVGNR
ncbi:MAG: sodium:solute symporter [Halioglobus sp.]